MEEVVIDSWSKLEKTLVLNEDIMFDHPFTEFKKILDKENSYSLLLLKNYKSDLHKETIYRTVILDTFSDLDYLAKALFRDIYKVFTTGKIKEGAWSFFVEGGSKLYIRWNDEYNFTICIINKNPLDIGQRDIGTFGV